MPTLLARRKWILADIEGTYGTDPAPVAADAVLTKNLTLAPYEGPKISRDNDRDTLGNDTVINATPSMTLSFDVELAGSAAAGTAPPYDVLLRACGLLATNTPLTDHVYTPRDTGFESVGIHFHHEGNRVLFLGARGNCQFIFERGQIPVMRFSFTGLYQKFTTTAEVSPDTSAYRTPVPMTNINTPTFSLIGYAAYELEALTIDMANQVVHRDVVNSEVVLITDRRMTMSLTIADLDVADNDVWADIESHAGLTTGVLQLIHGTTPDLLTFDSDSVQIGEVSSGESDGLATLQLSGVLTPDGSTEFSYTVA